MPDSFIGRRRQLAAARRALDRLNGGEGSVIVVGGDAGIGKSRLAREIAALGRGRGMDVVWGASWPASGAPAYWPWPEILAEVDPLIADSLDHLRGAGDTERFTMFRSVADALWRRATDRPVVVIVDDAHVVDADGLLLTRFLAQDVEGRRVLLLLTRRTGNEVAPVVSEMLDEIGRRGMVFQLEGLAPDEVREFIEHHGETPEDTAVQRLQELTGGNPFLMQQVLGARLHRRRGPVPDPARRLAEGRLDLLDGSGRATIEAAAVLGTGVTTLEVACVSGLDHGAVVADCQAGVRVGLLRPEALANVAFTHDLAREAVLSLLPSARLADLHRRCLEMLASGPATPERARRRAHHALALAMHAPADAREAIATAWQSALTLRAHGSPEVAVELLADALALHEKLHLGSPAPLLTDLAEATLATGRLSASKPLFRRAAAAAEDAHTFARAALGLGGIWLHEDRSAEDWDSYIDIVERAIERLQGDTSVEGPGLLRALQVRLVAERATVGEADIDEVFKALDAVRTAGSPGELAASLPLVHQTMLGPLHARDRVGVAEELIESARACGDDLHLVIGLMLRAADKLLLGEEADRELADLRTRADALGMRAILFVCDAIDVMKQMRSGDLEAAEAAAHACLERGVDVGDVDAYSYFSAQLLAIKWYQGTAAELLSAAQEIASSTLVPDTNPVFTAAVAALAAEAGDVDATERALALLGRDRLADLLPGSTWLAAMFCIVEAAVHLDDADVAEQAYLLLEPYESLPMMASLGICCLGSTARSLGLAARVAGRLDDAVAHLERAVTGNQRLGNRPMTAVARADLAAALAAKRSPGDRARASTLIAAAIDGATKMGLDSRLDAWRALQHQIDSDDAAGTHASLERHNGSWRLSWGQRDAQVAHSVGMEYLAKLLASPGTDVAVGLLVGFSERPVYDEVLDAAALRALQNRIHTIEARADRASLRNEPDEAARLQAELDELMAHLRTAVGPGGRSRRFDDATERARTSVQKAIRRAIDAIGRDCPDIAASLQASIKTGYQCRYDPVAGAPERWSVRSH